MSLVGETADYVANRLNDLWKSDEEYEIDHTFPFVCYKLSDISQHSKVMNFTNLQPLSPHENREKWGKLPTKAMAARVDRSCWPDGATEDMLPDIYPGWRTPLRM